MRWRQIGPQLAELTAIQAQILADASAMVKPGGRLVYATCSMLKDENEAAVAGFLAAHTDFTALDAGEVWRTVLPDAPTYGGQYLRLTPARHTTDGFFAAVLVRTEK